MIIENRLESRSFGPFASSTGIFLFAGGLIISYFNLAGILIAIVGGFIAFTSTSTIIDTEKRRIKHADFIFGLLPFGKWIDLKPDMKLQVHSVKRGYVGYIRGTQPYDIKVGDVRIFLCHPDKRRIMPVKKFKTAELAQAELIEISKLLGLTTT